MCDGDAPAKASEKEEYRTRIDSKRGGEKER